MASFKTPTTINGGCLCGGIRYKVDFAPEHDWSNGSVTCQCTMCRKAAGSLVFWLHYVDPKELTWVSKSTYTEYRSSDTGSRPFCNRCGSAMGFIDHNDEQKRFELAVGTIDEEFLVGERDENDRPKGAFGEALANPKGGHFHCRNELKGVTERIAKEGKRLNTDSEEGVVAND